MVVGTSFHTMLPLLYFILTEKVLLLFLTQESFAQPFSYRFIIELQAKIGKQDTSEEYEQRYRPGLGKSELVFP